MNILKVKKLKRIKVKNINQNEYFKNIGTKTNQV